MNAQTQFRQFNIRFAQIPKWKIVLIGAVAAALAITLALVAFAAFLVVFPVVLIAGAAYRLFGGSRKTTGMPERPGRSNIIDADYVVIEPGRERS